MAEVHADEGSLIVIIFDTNPCQKYIVDGSQKMTSVLESLVAFCNTHLMLKTNNKLAVLACHTGTSKFIFSDEDSAVSTCSYYDGQYELFSHIEKSLKKNIKNFILTNDPAPSGDSLIAGTCGMALCYIQRLERELPLGDKINSRILVITGSGESVSQYMNYMNVFFTAQKLNIIIDVCSLGQDLGILQQGCDLTGGVYLKVPQLQGLLQYLLWVFLPEPPLRKKLVLPPPIRVDYRAACFCHRQLVDIGYVCSVCLSIFCKFSPICTTCHALFKTPGPLPPKSKKKKKPS